jgi:lipopolysaccharide biosynthesis glycosyltransferase
MTATGSPAVGKSQSRGQLDEGAGRAASKLAPVHLICACNSNFNMPMCVMLSSVVEHFSKNRDLIIHAISNDATAKDRENVRQSIRMVRPSLERIDIHWYSIDAALLEKLPFKTDHLSRDAYARLFAPYLLPESCKRAVYLDCDMVVLADIAELYDSTAHNQNLLQAVHEMNCPQVSLPGGVFDYEKRGIPPDTRCFSSGVLVIDLKRWRERDLTPFMLEYVERYGDRIYWADQGVLNAFLYNEWTPLDPRWNQTGAVLFEKPWLAAGYSREEWLRVKNDPYIVHFTGAQKPWHAACRHSPRRLYFFDQLEKTVYRNTVPRYPYLERLMGRRAYYRFWEARFRLWPKRPARREPSAAAST